MAEPNEAITSFRQHGYALLRDVIPLDCLTDIKHELHSLVVPRDRKRGLTLEGDILRREADGHSKLYEASISVGSSLVAYELIVKAHIWEYAASALWNGGRNLHVTPLHIAIQLPRNQEFDYRWHQESSYYPWAPQVLNFWFPVLASTGMGTGTISLIPGSHHRGNRKAVKSDEDKFIQIEPEMDEAEESKAIAIDADPGDLLVFHADMIHRSLPNVSNVPRVTGILRVIDMSKIEARPLYKALAYTK